MKHLSFMIRGTISILVVLLFCVASSFATPIENILDPNLGHAGCVLSRTNGVDILTVEYIPSNGPASKAGIKQGDFITSINGVSTKGMSLEDAQDSLLGDIGSVVKLTLRREGSSEEVVSIVRKSMLDTILPAAMEGDARAELDLGGYYQYAPTSIRDLTKAADWYLKSAKQNNAHAERDLGYMYLNGWGVSKDLHTAIEWFQAAAKQGDSNAECMLGSRYFNGEGLDQSDEKAFAWYYSASRQDEATAESDLGYLYRNGRGVARSDRDAFNWYYRSAELGNPYGAWGLANLYEKGAGVTRNFGEALKCYQKALAALPENEKLKHHVIAMSLRVFFEDPSSAPLDLSLIMATFRSQILILFSVSVLFYLAGGIVLFYLSFRASAAPPKLFVAIGWIIFYLESQGVALFTPLIFEKSLTAGTLLATTAFFSALPVIASSCGSLRIRFWKSSEDSWKNLLIYAIGSFVTFYLISLGYAEIYSLITHSPLPLQPTQLLFSKAKHESAWLAYGSIALAIPIAEEIIFRGYLFEALKQHCSGKTVVFITAFAFSLVHFQRLYFIPLLGAGLILGWVRYRTDSLRLVIVLHIINNALFLAFAA